MADEKEKTGEHPGTEPDKLLTALDAVTKMCDSLGKRMDAWEAKSAEGKEVEQKDRARKDGEGMDEPVQTAADRDSRDEAEKADIQARADSVASAFGERSPRALSGETVRAYRNRLAGRFQRFCDEFKDIDLGKVADEKVFAGIEKRIYSDAMAKASTVLNDVPDGRLREVTKVDPSTGQRMTTFHGRGTFIRQLTMPSRRVVAIGPQRLAG